MFPRGFAEQSPKRDDRREAREVQENPRGYALQRQRILEVRPVPAKTKS